MLDLSNFYLDVVKDRLYVEKAQSATRRAAQTTIYRVLDTLDRLIAPILAFTSEEIWQFMPHAASCNRQSVLLNSMPTAQPETDPDFMARWEKIHAVRDDVKKSAGAGPQRKNYRRLAGCRNYRLRRGRAVQLFKNGRKPKSYFYCL